MAKKALIEKQQRTPKFKVRAYTRCRRCGRPKAVFKKFGLCRICLRVMVHAGEWVRYSTPQEDGAEYIAVCLPAFSMETVHRDRE